MLFNSYLFIFIFLPIVLLIFYLIGSKGYSRLAIAWLVVSSLFFYAWWNPSYLLLILCSMVFNYRIGKAIDGKEIILGKISRKFYLVFGITVNLGFLGYFKYINFFMDNLNHVFRADFHVGHIVLPLAISFFTFQQIAYLMDIYRGANQEHRFLHYCLFVTFFPHLIAGPLVHHQEMLPQFTRQRRNIFSSRYFSLGLTIFFIGLFKKLLIADNLESFVGPVFKAAAQGELLSFLEAWGGALAYAYQLYFDFSAYSDMAIGLALLFRIRLPLNFYSPYKAVNIIDFWTRWHMSLSRFLFTYLYIPLGGNRKGMVRQCINIMIVMCLGGLWHGAAWGFVIWGVLHGMYLIVNHLWRKMRESLGQNLNENTTMGVAVSRGITFFAVVIAWIFFRAQDLNVALSIVKGMLGINGLVVGQTSLGYLNHLGGLGNQLASWGVQFSELVYFKGMKEFIWLLIVSCLVWFAPNTHQIMGRYRVAFNIYRGQKKEIIVKWLSWRPTVFWAVLTAILAVVAILNLSTAKEFIYFQF